MSKPHAPVHHAHVHHTAAATAGMPSFGGIVGSLAFIAAFVLLIVYINAKSRERRGQAEQAAAETAAQHETILQQWMYDPTPPIAAPPGLIFESGEVAYFSGRANIVGHHTATHRVGVSVGPSVRVAKGIYLRASTFASRPVQKTYVAVDDTGTLTITNLRVIFIGSKSSVLWRVPDILSVTPFTDGVQVSPVNRPPILFQTGNEVASIVLQRTRLGNIGLKISPPTV